MSSVTPARSAGPFTRSKRVVSDYKHQIEVAKSPYNEKKRREDLQVHRGPYPDELNLVGQLDFEVEPHILHRYEEAQKHNVPNEQEVIFFCCFIYIVLLYFINSYCCYIIKIK